MYDIGWHHNHGGEIVHTPTAALTLEGARKACTKKYGSRGPGVTLLIIRKEANGNRTIISSKRNIPGSKLA